MDESIGVMLLGGGRLVRTTRLLRKACEKRGLQLRAYCYEHEADLPIVHEAHIIQGRPWKDKGIINHMRDLIQGYHISLILPMADEAIEVAANYADVYNETYTPLPSPALIQKLTDMRDANASFQENEIETAEIYHHGRPKFPLITYPTTPYEGLQIKMLRTVADYRRLVTQRIEDYTLLQVPEGEIFIADCFVTRTGGINCIVLKHRLTPEHHLTVKDEEMTKVVENIIDKLHLRGLFHMILLRSYKDKKILLINVRFIPSQSIGCSIIAGADLLGSMIDEAQEKIPEKSDNILSGVHELFYQDSVYSLDN